MRLRPRLRKKAIAVASSELAKSDNVSAALLPEKAHAPSCGNEGVIFVGQSPSGFEAHVTAELTLQKRAETGDLAKAAPALQVPVVGTCGNKCSREEKNRGIGIDPL